ncbi:MAG TPA: hypothetical protein ENN19_03505 [Chloroflexi bacterium]|nr:hypothetical protein [Chloroflexota bacterium]
MADQRAPTGPVGPIDIRSELRKVERMPRWGRVQGNAWDRASRFIYQVDDLDTLRRETKCTAARMNLPLWDFGCYVIRRWYNFHTHQVALDIILEHARTRSESDSFHHTIDFYLDDESFDLKLTGLPRGFGRALAYARAHPAELAHWLYANQSKQGRFHAANRLFVVLHDAVDPARTWELRRDFDRLEQTLHAFLDRPDPVRVEFTDEHGKRHQPLAGVVFCTRET